MLVEATVGVAVFCLLLILTLHGVSFMIQQTTVLQQRHHALCMALDDDLSTLGSNYIPAYNHASVQWYETSIKQGGQQVTFYTARYIL